MSEPTSRRAIALAAILMGLMVPRPASAQDLTGLPGDYLLLKTRQWQLRHDRTRLQADIDRGDTAAVAGDLQRVRRDQRRIEFDRWMLRSDLFLPLAFTTHPQRIPPVPADPVLTPHPQYPGYGYFPSDPGHLYRLPQPASPTADTPTSPGASAATPLFVEIVNAGPPGEAVAYLVDGVVHRVEGGRRERIAIGPDSTIAFDRGGGLGTQRYRLSAGVYEFRSGESGWAFFRVQP